MCRRGADARDPGGRGSLRCPAMASSEPERAREEAPICPSCGVTALPGSATGAAYDFVCDNPDCPAFGEPV